MARTTNVEKNRREALTTKLSGHGDVIAHAHTEPAKYVMFVFFPSVVVSIRVCQLMSGLDLIHCYSLMNSYFSQNVKKREYSITSPQFLEAENKHRLVFRLH